jgi:hypothetical protein
MKIKKNLSKILSFTYLLKVSASVGVILAQNNNTVEQNAKLVLQSRLASNLLQLSAPVGRSYMAWNENTEERNPNVVIHISAASICSCRCYLDTEW